MHLTLNHITAAFAALALAASSANAQRVAVTADGFTASTNSIEITVSSGAVTRVLNKLTGETHTSPVARSPWMPRGVLAMPETATGAQAVQTLHLEWGSHPIYGNTQLGESIARIARYPGQTTTCTVSRTAAGARGLPGPHRRRPRLPERPAHRRRRPGCGRRSASRLHRRRALRLREGVVLKFHNHLPVIIQRGTPAATSEGRLQRCRAG